MIAYLKASPTTWVMQFKNGKLKREGAGLSFFYWLPTTTLVQVPLASADVPFAFNEITADFQAVTVQGQLTYRVTDATRLAALLDYTTNAVGVYRSEDPQTGGVVFSDGMEVDSLAFNSGATVDVRPAAQRAQLVV